MSNNVFEHKGYCGSIEVSLDDDCLHGKILFINDLITYEGQTVAELVSAFKSAVERYLEDCKTIGVEPDHPFSGTFNVRIGPEMHKQAVIAAKKSNRTLNEFVKSAIGSAIAGPENSRIEHIHFFVLDREETTKMSVSSSGNFTTLSSHHETRH